MINEAWPLRPLGELFEISAGKTMSAAARSGADKTPFLRTSNVLWDEIDLSTVDEMAIPTHELQGKLLTPGDLLVCEGGDIGRAAVWNGEVATMSFQNHLHRLRPIGNDVEPHFYVYFLQSGFTQLGIFEGAGNKTTIPNLSRSRLAALDVPHPGIDEQRDIARALARVREAMKLHDQCLAVAQDLKRAAMTALFTRGLKGEAQKETDIGLVPESWDVVAIGDCCSVRNGFAFESKDYSQSGLLNFRVVNIQWGGGIDVLNDQKFLPHEFAKSHSNFLLDHMDILLVMVGATRGKICQVTSDFLPALMNQNMWRIKTINKELDQKFLYFQLLELVPSYMSKFSEGQRGFFKKEEFRAEFLKVPPLSEQNEIVAILDAIDRKIDLHKKKRAGLDELFKSLLRKLMTGEIRVADLDLSAIQKNAAVAA